MPTQNLIDRRQIAVAAVLCATGTVALFPPLHVLGVIAVVLTDAFIVSLILSAAAYSNAKGARHGRRFPYLPSRNAALAVLPLLLVTAVFSFAAIYRLTGEVHGATSVMDTIYFSVVTITTVGYGDMHPDGTLAKLAAIGEIATGILFLIGAFPLLVSRLTNFDDVTL